MPSNRRNNAHGDAASGGETAAAHPTEEVHGAADAAKTAGARMDEAKEKVAEVYNNAQQEAHIYVEKGKQAVENAVESAKESAKGAAANIQQKTYEAVDTAKKGAQPYVDQAKQTAAPYVEQARQTAAPYVDGALHAVETSKEKAQAVKRGVDKTVEDVHNFDITKTTFFATLVVMLASVLAWIWHCVESVNAIKDTVITIRDKATAIGVSDKVWEAYYYSTVMLEHVPVVGYRTAEVIRSYVEQVADEAREQFRRKEVEDAKKHN